MKSRPKQSFQEFVGELQLRLREPNNNRTVFVVVEGESDVNLFRPLLNNDVCKISEVPGGEPNILKVLQSIDSKFWNLIGIKDADFHHLLREAIHEERLFLTDFHDVEMMMVNEDDCFRKIILGHTDYESDAIFDLRSGLLGALSWPGRVRLWNRVSGNSLHFREMRFDTSYFDPRGIFIVELNFLQAVLSRSGERYKTLDPANVHREVLDNTSEDFELRQLVNGHDFLHALAKVLNTRLSKLVDGYHLAESLRMHYSYTHFMKSRLFLSLSEYGQKHGVQIVHLQA